MKRILTGIFLALLAFSAVGLLVLAPLPSTWPELRSGDLVFQTGRSPQTPAIALATASLYTHVGLVRLRGEVPEVIDSSGSVGYRSFQEWLEKGYGGRYAVYRNASLSPTEAEALLTVAERYTGRGYDRYFSFGNRTLYCSELPYLAFRGVGHPVGREQRLGELWIQNRYVKELMASRWSGHPACRDTNDRDTCYERLLTERLITPVSLANDPAMTRVFSNYLGGLL